MDTSLFCLFVFLSRARSAPLNTSSLLNLPVKMLVLCPSPAQVVFLSVFMASWLRTIVAAPLCCCHDTRIIGWLIRLRHEAWFALFHPGSSAHLHGSSPLRVGVISPTVKLKVSAASKCSAVTLPYLFFFSRVEMIFPQHFLPFSSSVIDWPIDPRADASASADSVLSSDIWRWAVVQEPSDSELLFNNDNQQITIIGVLKRAFPWG